MSEGIVNSIIQQLLFSISLIIELVRYSYEKYTRALYSSYQKRDINGKIAIVTGANTGIGKATVYELVSRGATVILACRNQKLGQKAMADIRARTGLGKMDLMILDLADLASVQNFCCNFRNKYSALDILVNNAGVYDTTGQYSTTNDGFEVHVGVNYLGHFLLVELLKEMLKRTPGSRVISVSSSLQLFASPYYDPNDLLLKIPKSWGLFNSLGYGMSKYYISLHMRELQRRLEPFGVSCYSVCPGFVDTEIFRSFSWYEKIASDLAVKLFGIAVQEGCRSIIFLALCESGRAKGGQFYRFNRLHGPINSSLKMDIAEGLWKETERLLKRQLVLSSYDENFNIETCTT